MDLKINYKLGDWCLLTRDLAFEIRKMKGEVNKLSLDFKNHAELHDNFLESIYISNRLGELGEMLSDVSAKAQSRVVQESL